MKIERDSVGAPNRIYRQGDVARQPATAGNPAAALGDQVSLSGEALHGNNARELLASQPQARAALVNSLKAQIEQGAYRVHAQTLADRLLRDKVFEE